VADRPFTVRTIELDLPALAGAFSRRLHDAGVPVTAERAARFARSLTLVAPQSRRRLYWTARAALISGSTQVAAFDAVFFSVFGSREDDSALRCEDLQRVAAPPDHRPVDQSHGDREPPRTGAAEALAGATSTAPPGDRDEEPERQIAVPVQPSPQEVLRTKRFDALEPDELAAMHALMTQLRIATPRRRTRRHQLERRGERIDMRRTLRASMRTGGDPIRLAHRRRRVLARRMVMLLDISGSMEPYARAADPVDAGPELREPGTGPGARRHDRARLVQRHAHRRRAAQLQRPPRPARHGPRRGDRDPLRRLGARRSRARRPRDGAPRPPRLPDRLGQPPRGGGRVLAAGGRHGGRAPALRRARQRAQPAGAGGGRRGDRGVAGRCPDRLVVGAGSGARGAVGQRHARGGELRCHAQRLWAEQREDDPGMESMKTCIYPGCERPAVPAHPLGGPQPSFCDREDHNALTAHQERQRRAGMPAPTRRGA
jgi:hypothetical protein